MLAFTSDTVSPAQLRTIADWTFQRRLRAVQGVAHVEVFGGDVKQYQVLVDPDRLQHYQVSLDEIVAAASAGHRFRRRGLRGDAEPAAAHPPTDADHVARGPGCRAGRHRRRGADVTRAVGRSEVGAADKPGDATINGTAGRADARSQTTVLQHASPFPRVFRRPSMNWRSRCRKASNCIALCSARRPSLNGPSAISAGHRHRLPVGDADPRRLPVPVANRADQPDGDPAVAAGSDSDPAGVRGVAERHDAGRPGHCVGRSG